MRGTATLGRSPNGIVFGAGHGRGTNYIARVNLDRRNELLRTVLGGAVGAALGAIVSASPLVVLAGAVLGVVLAFGVERVLDGRAELLALRARAAEFDAAERQREQERELWEHRIAVAQRESDLNAAMLKVWGDAYTEGTRSGSYPPLEVLMARLAVTQKAQGLDKPDPTP